MRVPAGSDFFQTFGESFAEIDHGLQIGEEDPFLVGSYEIQGFQWFLDAVFYYLKILDVGSLGGYPFVEDVDPLLCISGLLLPMLQTSPHSQHHLQLFDIHLLLTDLLFQCHLHPMIYIYINRSN